ncbi:MAG: NADPH-dependent F420 reductase [Chloroflexi bacterium]|nr:NADPH-dependent F420 reductase [Chloroflexota bacterium]MDA1003971.1 NADPH-dependent F420 reductase [Chloroflexota bacterium]
MPHTIALIGGTGPEGRGLAIRLALAGHRVIVGSRDAARGASVAAELEQALSGRTHGALSGDANEGAVAAGEIVIVTVPYDGHRATLEALRAALAGKIVIDTAVPMRFERGPHPVDVADGSATEEAAAILTESRVVGAFHNLSATVLQDPDAPVDADVLVTGGDAEAKQIVIALANEIAGVRGIDAGPLRFSRFVEQITILLIGVNGRYKAHTGVRIVGLDH